MTASTATGGPARASTIPQEDHRAQVAVLTGLRGFAALMVVLIHTAGRTDYPGVGIPSYGPVSLFVLSGFLLYRPWSSWAVGQGARPSVRTFVRRRIYRIFPAYLAVVVIVAVLSARSHPNGWDGWARALTLTHIYASDGLRPGLEQTWSLGTELSWYVALPVMGAVVGLVARRFRPKVAFYVVVAALVASVPVTAGWRWYVHVEDLGPRFTYSFWLPGFLVCFAAGALVAHLLDAERSGLVRLDRLRAVVARQWPVALVVGAAAVVGLSALSGPDGYVPATFTERQVRFVAAIVISVGLLVAAAVGPMTTVVNRALRSRPMNAIGRWSYGIYLWHLPVVALLSDEFRWRSGIDGFALWLVTILTISVPLGAASWAWVEKPMIARSKRRRPRSADDPTGDVDLPGRTPAPTSGEPASSSAESPRP